MRTHTQSKFGNLSYRAGLTARFVPLIIAVIAALKAPVLLAGGTTVAHNLDFTENSSTSLIVTYDGSTTGIMVTNVGPDHWTVTLPPTLIFSAQFIEWDEPESTLVNVVGLSPGSASVFSDTGDTILMPFPDEFTVTNIGTDIRDQRSISATFDDEGDIATVPETGSTFGLLFLSLIALLGASRLRTLQPA